MVCLFSFGYHVTILPEGLHPAEQVTVLAPPSGSLFSLSLPLLLPLSHPYPISISFPSLSITQDLIAGYNRETHK